jgi:hypothetical protein
MDQIADIDGEMVGGEHPDWTPLVNALLGWFMWMFEVELVDGRRLHAYKHIVTREYLHLTHDERAFVFRGEHSYREVDLEEAVAGVFARWWSLSALRAPPD